MSNFWNAQGHSLAFNNGTGLASREAVEGFAYGAQLQQQGHNKPLAKRKGGSKSQQELRIRDVWADNLKEEMDLLEQLVEKYRYIAMDTEFPGIVARPMGAFTTRNDYHYQCLRCNVDLLKVIQLGIAIFDEDGNSPPANLSEIPGITHYPNNLKTCPTTWQFNFKFSLDDDMYNQDSVKFLQDAGLDFQRFTTHGIDPEKFGARLITSGLAYFDDVNWISYHSGYDFAYLVKIMNRNELPEDESEYRRLMNIYFPSIFDIKMIIHMLQKTMLLNNNPDDPPSPEARQILSSLSSKGGLQPLAEELHVRRIGVAHFAGSDALLTGRVFWEVKRKLFADRFDSKVYLGHIWGLGTTGTTIISSPQSQAATSYIGGIEEQASSTTPNLNGATIYHQSTPSNHQQQQGYRAPTTPANSHAHPVGGGTPQRPQTGGNNERGGGFGGVGGVGGGVFSAFGKGFGRG